MKKLRNLYSFHKRYALAAAGLCCVLVLCALGQQFAGANTNAAQKGYRELLLEHGDLKLTFMGEGTTAEGSIQQEAEFDVTAVDFVVEESYAASGDEVKKGDALYQLSSDSMEAAAAYYEEQVAKAAKAADRAKTSYESGTAEAEYTRTTAKAKAGSAKETYDAANSRVEERVAEAQAAVEEAQAQIDVYRANLDQGVYETDAGISEKKKASEAAAKSESQAKKEYEKAKKAFEEANLTLNVKISELQQKASETTDGAILSELALELGEANQALAQKKEGFEKAEKSLQQAQEAARKAEEEYHTANTSYEKAVSDATARKEELENSLASLQRAYTNAVNAAELEKVQNQNAYETAVLQGEYAEVDYENTEFSLKAEYEAAQEELDRLKEEQTALLALENGVVTAAYDGILSQVPYEAGNKLQKSIALVGYSDTDMLTVAVEVSQEDIVKIAVGDTAEVVLPGMRMGSVEGMVSYIATEATSGRSISNVTYTVEVTIDNSDGAISSGTSAYVTFCYGELTDVDYILTEALSNIDQTSATVKVYNADEEVEDRQVTIGESTDRYTVITDGLDADTVCVIEGEDGTDGQVRDIEMQKPQDRMGEGAREGAPSAEEPGQNAERPDAESEDFKRRNPDTDSENEKQEDDRTKMGGNENGQTEK